MLRRLGLVVAKHTDAGADIVGAIPAARHRPHLPLRQPRNRSHFRLDTHPVRTFVQKVVRESRIKKSDTPGDS